MKKLLCIFALSLAFSACSQQPAEITPTPQPAEEVTDFSTEVLQTEIDELETSDYLYYGWEKAFEAAGLTAEISNATLADKDYVTFDINISNGTDTLVLPIKAELLYYMHEEIPRGIQTQWGHINVADGQLILTKYDFDKGCSVIEHYNAQTLQLVDAVEMQNSADLRLLNTALYNGAFISQYWISDRDMGILLIRRDGLVEQQIIFNGGYAYRNDSHYNHPYGFYSQDIELLTADLILVGGSDLYSLQSGQCHSVSSICGYTQGDTAFKLYRSNSGNKAIKPYFALLYKNGKVTDSFLPTVWISTRALQTPKIQNMNLCSIPSLQTAVQSPLSVTLHSSPLLPILTAKHSMGSTI